MAVFQENCILGGSFAHAWADGAKVRCGISNVAFTGLPFINHKIGRVNRHKLLFSFRFSDLQCLGNIPEAQ